VRQVKLPPRIVVEAGLLSPSFVAQVKPPPGVEGDGLPRPRKGLATGKQERDEPAECCGEEGRDGASTS